MASGPNAVFLVEVPSRLYRAPFVCVCWKWSPEKRITGFCAHEMKKHKSYKEEYLELAISLISQVFLISQLIFQ